MKREFGLEGGRINCRKKFVVGMEPLCGQERIIEQIDECDGRVYFNENDEGYDKDLKWSWNFSLDMIEKVEQRQFKVGDTVRVREWDDLAREYKKNGSGSLVIKGARNCVADSYIHTHAKYLCGGTYKIKKIDIDDDDCYFEGEGSNYIPSKCLILVKEAEQPEPEPEPETPEGDEITYEELMFILKEGSACTGKECDECALQDGGMEDERTKKILKKAGLIDDEGYSCCKPCVEIAGMIAVKCFEQQQKKKPEKHEKPQPKPKQSAQCEKCSVCKNKTELDGGYLMCQSWHNITVPDGYCFRFEAE